MKSFAEAPRPSFTIPMGKAFPRAPAPRELFYLERDLPDVDENNHVVNPWYCRGAYVYDGLNWQRITDGGREVRTSLIPSATYEIETLGVPMDQPMRENGFTLTSQTIRTSHRKAKISGTASAWVDVSRNGHVWLSVFRDRKLINVVMEFVEADRPRTMSLSFLDSPFEHANVTYSITMNSNVLKSMGNEFGMVYVNRSKQYTFEGISQTAFTLSENTNW